MCGSQVIAPTISYELRGSMGGPYGAGIGITLLIWCVQPIITFFLIIIMSIIIIRSGTDILTS